MSKTPAPPNPADHLSRKLLPRRRVPSVFMRMPSLARKIIYLLFSFYILLVNILIISLRVVARKKKNHPPM
jgi:hypothetical protein